MKIIMNNNQSELAEFVELLVGTGEHVLFTVEDSKVVETVVVGFDAKRRYVVCKRMGEKCEIIGIKLSDISEIDLCPRG